MSQSQMRLTYVFPYAQPVAGIESKLKAQVAALEEEFLVDVTYVIPFGGSRVRRTVMRLWNELRLPFVLKKNADVVFMRYTPYTPFLNILTSCLAIFVPVSVELNIVYENELNDDPIGCFLHRISMCFLKASKTWFLPVTDEIGRKEGIRSDCYSVLGNGYAALHQPGDDLSPLNEIGKIFSEQREHGRKVLVFAASTIEPWPRNGFDRICQLVLQLPDTYLACFGRCDSPPIEWEELHQEGRTQLFGNLGEEVLHKVYKQADFGVGIFGLDRINLEEACPLKTRGYLTAGLRVIAGYHDTVLDEDWACPHYLKVKPDNMNELERFLRTPYDHEELRILAGEKLSWLSIFLRAGVMSMNNQEGNE